MVQIQTALENLIDLCHLNVLNDKLAVGNPVLFSHGLVGCGLFGLFAVLVRCISFEKVTIFELTLAQIYHFLQFRDAVEDKKPAFTKIVTLIRGQFKNLLDYQNVLVLDSLLDTDLGKLSK